MRSKKTSILRFAQEKEALDQVLSFDNEEVMKAFNAAKDAGIYEKVLLYTGKHVQHYGLNNHKEYFAESTEAYFGVNDFYPFVRAELKEHDPKMFNLMETVWGKIRWYQAQQVSAQNRTSRVRQSLEMSVAIA